MLMLRLTLKRIVNVTYVGTDAAFDRLNILKGGVLVSIVNWMRLDVVADELDGVFQTIPEGGVP